MGFSLPLVSTGKIFVAFTEVGQPNLYPIRVVASYSTQTSVYDFSDPLPHVRPDH